MTSTISRPRRVAALGVGLAVALSGATVVATADSASAGSATSQYGTLSAPDGVLPAANRCGVYTYSYDLKPPPGDWGLETFVTDPRGNVVASYVVLDGYSQGGGSSSTNFTLCRNYTAPGAFRIDVKLSTDDGLGNITYYKMDPATFTLVEPTRTKKHTKAKQGKKNKLGKKGKKKAGRK